MICAVKVGIEVTVIVCLGTFAIVVVGLRALAAWSFRRINAACREPGFLLGAEALFQGKPGVMHVFTDAVRWEARRLHEAFVLPALDVAQVAVEPTNSILIPASRLTFTMADGREIKMTVTAPSKRVVSALRSATTQRP